MFIVRVEVEIARDKIRINVRNNKARCRNDLKRFIKCVHSLKRPAKYLRESLGVCA